MKTRSNSFWYRYSKEMWILLAAVTVFLVGNVGGLAAGIAAGFAGAIFWWLLIERPSEPTFPRGVLFGVLTVITAHFIVYIVAGILHLPIEERDRPVKFTFSGLFPSLVDILQILEGAAFYGIVGLFFAGLITIPLGIITGLLLVAFRQKVQNISENE